LIAPAQLLFLLRSLEQNAGLLCNLELMHVRPAARLSLATLLCSNGCLPRRPEAEQPSSQAATHAPAAALTPSLLLQLLLEKGVEDTGPTSKALPSERAVGACWAAALQTLLDA
jgi:hypothetical protein